MTLQKREFYEGAALHQLFARDEDVSAKYTPPFFVLNRRLFVYFKYCTKSRSPWGFTFNSDEHRAFNERDQGKPLIIALICGSDGIVALNFLGYKELVDCESLPAHFSCYRNHGQHYEINGPKGRLEGKIAPSAWKNLLSYEVL